MSHQDGRPTAADGEELAPYSLPLRMAAIGVILVLAGVLVVWGVDLGRRLGLWESPGPNAAQAQVLLQDELTRVTTERDALAAAQKVSATDLEQARQKISVLGADNGKLQNDLAIVESVMPAEKAGVGLVVKAFRAGLVGQDQLHYVALLGFGASKKHVDFKGRLHLLVTLKKGDSDVVLQFPQEGAADVSRYEVTVDGYQRLDGLLRLPPGTSAVSVELRLLDGDDVVARQSASVVPTAAAAP